MSSIWKLSKVILILSLVAAIVGVAAFFYSHVTHESALTFELVAHYARLAWTRSAPLRALLLIAAAGAAAAAISGGLWLLLSTVLERRLGRVKAAWRRLDAKKSAGDLDVD